MSLLCYELTNRCDIACLHCLRDKVDVRQDIERDLVLRTLDEARSLGVQTISFTGGEPTLHPDYLFFVDEVVKRGFQWVTVTNGHNTDLLREVFQDVKRRKASNVLAISLDGATEETHDQIRGKGSFRKILRTAILLSGLKVPFRLQMMLTTLTYPEIEQFPLLASQMGATVVNFSYMQATKKNLASGLMLSPDEYRRAQIRIHELNRVYKITISQNFGFYHVSPQFKCSVLQNNALNIDYLGNMIFCCQLSNFGDVSYVRDRKEIVADLNQIPLVEGYKLLLERVAQYNMRKAERAAQGKIKGLDLFPCHYCAKEFGKLDWLASEPKAKAWQDDAHELPKALTDEEWAQCRPKEHSLFPTH